MQSLPIEILEMIGKWIALDNEGFKPVGKKTLLALSMCCRQFYKIFEPILYYHLDLGSNPNRHDIHLIIRLWKHPKLADRVRSLRLSWGYETIYINDADDDEHEEFAEFLPEALKEMFTFEEELIKTRWMDGLLGFVTEAWLGLLLVRLTRLETISMDLSCSAMLVNHLLNKAAKRERPFHKSPPFPFLRNAIVRSDAGWSSGEEGISECLITPFFHFQNVHSIIGQSVWASRQPAQNANHALQDIASPGSVKSISVSQLWECSGSLTWFGACRELECLSLGLSLHPEEYGVSVPFDPRVLNRALLPFKDTLKHLEVTYDRWYNRCLELGSGRSIPEDNIPFESFREFSALEHLGVRHAHLVRIFQDSPVKKHKVGRLIDRLPSSLQTLVVYDVLLKDPGLLSELLTVIRNRNLFPHLKILQLFNTHPDDWSASEDETTEEESIEDETTEDEATVGLSFLLEGNDKEYVSPAKLARECRARGIDMGRDFGEATDSETE
ncbi:hypothetical protein ASPBRDRAFT_145383, partial [Aspergillus brasiliensis CBS 101740]